MKKFKFLDLSGFGASGKGAVIDLLREFDDRYYVPHYSFEFALLRIKDGLINLHQDLVENWSPSRADTALKRFSKMTKKIASNPSWYNVFRRFFSTGLRYEHYFNGQFLKITQDYLDKLIEYKYRGLSPFPFQNSSDLNYSLRKMFHKIFFPYYHCFGEKMTLAVNNHGVFIQYTKEYLDDLFENIVGANKNSNIFILLNACEPYNSSLSLDLLYLAQQIVVDRDPRDLYLSTCLDERDAQTQGLFSGSKNLVDFVYRYRVLRERSKIKNLNLDNRILQIYFEDLVLNYDEVRYKIYDFLDEDCSVHINQRKYFNPDVSIKGVGMWRNTSRKAEVDYIQQHLQEYCRDY